MSRITQLQRIILTHIAYGKRTCDDLTQSITLEDAKMNAQRTEVLKLEYRLPSLPGNHFQAWQSTENGDIYPDDRAQQERRNRAEFAAKSAAHLITRRPRVA